ncbi:MAG: chaperonin GroEL [Planctomycetota bacterium]|jgi:chaperonin GroEL
MAAKEIQYAMEGRKTVYRGVKQLADAVRITLGPCGKNVILQRSSGPPVVTKDGVTVAKEIELPDPLENMGAQMIKEVASRTNREAGDGTTTATILAVSIFREGLKNVAAGANPMELRRGIAAAVRAVVDQFKTFSTPVSTNEQITQIATVAANHDTRIGEIVAQAMEKAGKHGAVNVDEGKSLETTVELVDGFQFDKGFVSHHFVNSRETLSCIFENAFILIHEKKISNAKELVPFLEKVFDAKRPLLIIAEEVEGDALATLIVNTLQGTLPCCAVKAPGFGDRRKAILEDIAIQTGAHVVTEDTGLTLTGLDLSHLGRARKIIVEKGSTTIIEGQGETKTVHDRIEHLRRQVELTTGDYDREKLEERLACLSGGVAQIHVGAATEIELKEKKMRIDDAVHACRAAVDEGVLTGGGVAMLRSSFVIDRVVENLTGDQRLGAEIVRRALSAPLKQIAANAGVNGSIAWQRVVASEDPNFGYDALAGSYGNLVRAGILVPTKVERVVLQNSASAAAQLLTTEAVIGEFRKKCAKPSPVRSA